MRFPAKLFGNYFIELIRELLQGSRAPMANGSQLVPQSLIFSSARQGPSSIMEDEFYTKLCKLETELLELKNELKAYRACKQPASSPEAIGPPQHAPSATVVPVNVPPATIDPGALCSAKTFTRRILNEKLAENKLVKLANKDTYLGFIRFPISFGVEDDGFDVAVLFEVSPNHHVTLKPGKGSLYLMSSKDKQETLRGCPIDQGRVGYVKDWTYTRTCILRALGNLICATATFSPAFGTIKPQLEATIHKTDDAAREVWMPYMFHLLLTYGHVRLQGVPNNCTLSSILKSSDDTYIMDHLLPLLNPAMKKRKRVKEG